jgi:hypothetical protein
MADNTERVYILQYEEPYERHWIHSVYSTLEAAKVEGNFLESELGDREWVSYRNSKSFNEWTTVRGLDAGWTITEVFIDNRRTNE